MIMQLVHIFFWILFIYLAVNISYLLFLSVAGLFKRKRNSGVVRDSRRIAVLITSYKEDRVILNTVISAVNHDYPAELFHVFIAADHMQQDTLAALEKTGATIHALNFERGSKARSLNHLLNAIDPGKYDIALVLDGDNIMMPGLLRKINEVFQADDRTVVQAHRTAKNLHTPVAILDALSEEVNNHLFRQAPWSISISSSLIGSGMAFPFSLLKSVYNKPGILDNPACDREVDFEMLVHGYKVKYVPEAVVLDEKVAVNKVYRNQRRRWLESQLVHVRLFFTDWKRVRPKTADFWHKLFINLLPPRILMLGVFLGVLLTCFAGAAANVNFTGVSYRYWIILFAAYLLSIAFAVPRRFFNVATVKAFLFLPVILFSFIKAACTMRWNRKEFVHTPKTFTGNSASTNQPK